MKKNYSTARRYAGKLKPYSPTEPLDLVHDAFVTWYKKTGKNLFDEELPTVLTCVRYVFLDFIKRKKWSKDKEWQGTRQNVELEEHHVVYSITPHDELVGKELMERMKTLLNETNGMLHQIIEKRFEGFTNTEIAEKLVVAKSLITYYLKNVDLTKLKDD